MRIAAVHDFDAPVAAMEDALLDPEFWRELRLRDVDPPAVLTSEPTRIELAMAWDGRLDGLGRRIAGAERVTWRQAITLDRARATGTLVITSDLRVKATCRATLRFAALGSDGARTRRSLDGELKVNVPIVGGQAERKLAPGIQQRLDDEAAALRTWLAAP